MWGRSDEHPQLWLHGVSCRRDLLRAGVTSRAIEHRLKSGLLIALYTGVYALGHDALTVDGRRRAVVLACGEGAVLSHRSAAGAWGMRPDSSPTWNVTVRTASRRRAGGAVRVFRHPTLRDEEITTLEGIPITTPARTLLDLASVVPVHQLRRAIERAEELERFDLRALHHTLEAHRGRPGTRVLAALLKDMQAHGLTRTRSDLEALFLQICLDHRLPRPTINRHRDGRELDATWPGRDLIVEIDSWRHHRSRTAFGRDRAKDRRALLDGRRTARYTGDELESRPAAVAAELRALLGLHRACSSLLPQQLGKK
jgi:hypothetical protein